MSTAGFELLRKQAKGKYPDLDFDVFQPYKDDDSVMLINEGGDVTASVDPQLDDDATTWTISQNNTYIYIYFLWGPFSIIHILLMQVFFIVSWWWYTCFLCMYFVYTCFLCKYFLSSADGDTHASYACILYTLAFYASIFHCQSMVIHMLLMHVFCINLPFVQVFFIVSQWWYTCFLCIYFVYTCFLCKYFSSFIHSSTNVFYASIFIICSW